MLLGDIALVAVGKVVAKHAVSSVIDDGAQRAILEEIADLVMEQVPDSIRASIKRAGVNRELRERLETELTIFDMLAIKWGDELACQSDSDFREAGLPAMGIQTKLGLRWFREVLLRQSESKPEFAQSLVASDVDGNWVAASEKIATEIRNELDIDKDGRHLQWVQARLLSTVEAVAALIRSDPQFNSRIQTFLTERLDQKITVLQQLNKTGFEQLRMLLSGEMVRDEAVESLKTAAAAIVASANQDVFRRGEIDESDPSQLPKLELASTYLEPFATDRQHRRAPIRQMIRESWQATPARLVMLLAQFGYGKSLSLRSLAVDLAAEWLESPEERPFPVYVSAPDYFLLQIGGVKTAVTAALGNYGLSEIAAEMCWRKIPLALLVDSFDEVGMETREAEIWIRALRGQTNHCRITIGSRPQAMEQRFIKPDDTVLSIEPFNSEQIRLWLSKCGSKLRSTPPTLEQLNTRLDSSLLGVPILLLMATWIIDLIKAEKQTQTAIFRAFVERISFGKWTDVQAIHAVVERGLDRLSGKDAFQHALQMIAWESTRKAPSEEHGHALSRKEMETLLQGDFSLNDNEVADVARSMLFSGLIGRAHEKDSFHFTHRSFREFLVAQFLIRILVPNEGPKEDPASRARLALTELRLSEPTIKFSSELLAERSPEDRERVVSLLDEAYCEQRAIFQQQDDDVTVQPDRRKMMWYFVPNWSRRSIVARHNAERLGAWIRGNTKLLNSHLHGEAIPVANDVYRTVGNNLAYHKATGRIAVVWRNFGDDFKSTYDESLTFDSYEEWIVLSGFSLVVIPGEGVISGDGVRSAITIQILKGIVSDLSETSDHIADDDNLIAITKNSLGKWRPVSVTHLASRQRIFFASTTSRFVAKLVENVASKSYRRYFQDGRVMLHVGRLLSCGAVKFSEVLWSLVFLADLDELEVANED